MARPLILTPEVRQACLELIKKAAARPTRWEDTRALAEKAAAGMVHNPLNDDLTITIPHGYRVTYTHEYQREDLVCRHISVSAEGAKPKTGPSPHAVVEIIAMFGFINPLGAMPAWVSTADDGSLIIEMVEPLDGDVSQLMRDRDALPSEGP